MRRMLWLSALGLLACARPVPAAAMPLAFATVELASADTTFKVTTSPCVVAPVDTAATVSCRVVVADSAQPATVYGSVTVARGAPASLTFTHPVTPLSHFAVGVTAAGVNRSGALSSFTNAVFASFTNGDIAPGQPATLTVTICIVGSPGC